MRLKIWIIFILFCFSGTLMANSFTIEAETMVLEGQYAGAISSPFGGIALYANGDKGSVSHTFSEGNGKYRVTLVGASNNTQAAGVSLYINNSKIKAFTFYGTAASTLVVEVKLTNLTDNANTISVVLETDNGSSDTYLDKIIFEYLGEIVVKNPPIIPEQGAYYTGNYRNMLAEAGYSAETINQKLAELWAHYFYGNAETQTIYYPVGTDEAYILDINNNDVRSEGMSYGMMICVQMNKQAEFNRLWKWAKTHMQFQESIRKGYFSWQINADGSNKSNEAAPDGDEYFAMALMFAAGRWGNGEGIYNYWKEANEILYHSLAKEQYINASVTNMFNEAEQQVVFVPYASSAKHTDPSYHLPAFYQLWGQWADTQRSFWNKLAQKSRQMFPLFANETTGLMPDYANFNGTATGSNHADFRYDAWRCAMNMALDYSWFKADENEVELINRLHNFFNKEGIDSYGSEYSLVGKKLNTDHSPGLVACNATGALASNQAIAWDFIDDFFQLELSTGRYRYYDGLLYFLNYLILSGNYRIYTPAEVLTTALDERYTYANGYLLLNDFELQTIGDEYFMYQTETSTASATVVANPANAAEKSLQILPGNYDEFLYYEYTLPQNRTLKEDYSHLEFDIYYDPMGDNAKQDLKVNFDKNSGTPFFKTSTGEKSSHGTWQNIVVPLSGNTAGNSFKLFVGVRTRNANFYIDNLKLKMKYAYTDLREQAQEKYAIRLTNEQILLPAAAEKLYLYNVSGNLILQKTNVLSVDISSLPAGIYLLQAEKNGKKHIQKIIK